MAKFQLLHQRAFGLEIVERHPTTSEVVAVRCLFCVHLGREPAPENAVRKRRRTMQVWTKFAPQNYRSHHDGQHAEQWMRYQACSSAEKDTFFGAQMKNPGSRSGGKATETSSNEQRPTGRPREEGSGVPIQWSNNMTRHLVKLRYPGLYSACFLCAETNHYSLNISPFNSCLFLSDCKRSVPGLETYRTAPQSTVAGCSSHQHSQASLPSWWTRSSARPRYRGAHLSGEVSFLFGLTILM